MKFFLYVGCLAVGASVAESSKFMRASNAGNAATDHQEFVETLHSTFGDAHRDLQAGERCGGVAPCAKGAVCSFNEEKGTDWCLCDESSGYFNKPDEEYLPNIVKYDLQGYFSCIEADECKNEFGTSNVCGGEGVGCVDESVANGRYECFCLKGYVADTASIGDHGPEICINPETASNITTNATFNVCATTDNPCGGDKDCVFIAPNSFVCVCAEGLTETEAGICLNSTEQAALDVCDPVRPEDTCPEEERFCDRVIRKCLCKEGYIQPAGAGGQCIPIDECEAKLDTKCDQRGRGTSKPRSRCIENAVGGTQPVPGYSCECLEGFQDFPNSERGTNCVEVTPAPVAPVTAAPTTAAPVAAIVLPDPTPGPCSGVNCPVVGSTCALALGRCVCTFPYLRSLSSTFGCDAKCSVDTDCGDDFHCVDKVGKRCLPCPAGLIRESTSTSGCDAPFVLLEPVADISIPAKVEETFSPSFDCLISDLDVQMIISHGWIGELEIGLVHEDSGTSVRLFGDNTRLNGFRPCGNVDDLDVIFDDEASSDITSSCGTPGRFKPTIDAILPANKRNPMLSGFNGEHAAGTWILIVEDLGIGGTGTLDAWGLDFQCLELPYNCASDTDCPSDSYCDGDAICVICPSGQVRDAGSSVGCKVPCSNEDCDSNFVCNVDQACDPCPYGQFRESSSPLECTTIATSEPNLVIPNGQTKSDTLVYDVGCDIDVVELEVQIDIPNTFVCGTDADDYAVTLTQDFTSITAPVGFGSNTLSNFDAESSKSGETWTLSVTNNANCGNALLESWSLEIQCEPEGGGGIP